jgi:DNA (cytosine-5)-methyltransferase 1
MGYHRAGFDVVGVDIAPQPHYPFTFVQADALTVFEPDFWLLGGIESFNAIHASPPCQAFTQMSARWRGKGGKADSHPDLLTPTRSLLVATGLPYVIENVPGAKRLMRVDLRLHGGMFGLGVHRPRLFESNVWLMSPLAGQVRAPIGVYGKCDGTTTYRYRNNGNYKGKSLIRAWKSIDEGREAMEIDWMIEERELAEAIPPAYTELIGHQLMQHLRVAA